MPELSLRPRGAQGRSARSSFTPRLETLEDRTLLSVASVFNPADATWYLHTANKAGAADAGIFRFGAPGSKGVVGDWNGDGESGIGAFNPTTSTWTLRQDASAGLPNAGVFQLGNRRWIPVVGDWDGNGTDGIGGFDPRTATWHLHNNLRAGSASVAFRFGQSRWLPVVGDWDGNGTVGIGGYDPVTLTWHLRNSLSAGPADIVFRYGNAPGLQPVVGDWDNDGDAGIGIYNPVTRVFHLRNSVTPGVANVVFAFGPARAQAVVGDFEAPPPTPTTPPPASNEVLKLRLKPIDLNLLGLQIETNEIEIKVSAQGGDGKLLGNLLNTVTRLINLQGANAALNTVLGSVVDLVNSVDLAVLGVDPSAGPFGSSSTTTATPILDVFVAPVHLDLLGAVVDTSPIHLKITAHSGNGLVLGNVVTALANLFNPPLPEELDLDFINERLAQLLEDLNLHAPGIGSAPTSTPAPPAGTDRVLSLNLAPINLDLLGLVLKTSQIQVNVDATTGDGLLLGNVVKTLLNTLGATPENLDTLNANINGLLAKVIGILNASSLSLPTSAINSLSTVLQTLALPNLISSNATASAPILDLIIASTDGTSPPVKVDLLGLLITTSNIEANLSAQTGEGKVLGNLLYNLAHLLDPGGSLNLLTILGLLGL